MNRKKGRNLRKEENEDRRNRSRVVIPYIQGLSENIARIYKRYNIETVHKPTSTLKNILCNKMKDKVHELDVTGAVYHTECSKHTRNYVGETERVWRARLYEHKVVSHKVATKAASITREEEEEKETSTGTEGNARRSTRGKAKIDYKAMHEGSGQILTEGNTEFSAHVATEEHRKEDFEYSIIYKEENWFKRGIKEAIAIRKLKPNLNQDEGRYHLSAIYDNVIRSRLTIETPEKGTQHHN